MSKLLFLNEITDWYQNWLTTNKLPQLSADELLHAHFYQNPDVALNEAQVKIVKDFIIVWDKMVDLDSELSVAENFKTWLTEEKITAEELDNVESLSESQRDVVKAFKNIIFLVSIR